MRLIFRPGMHLLLHACGISPNSSLLKVGGSAATYNISEGNGYYLLFLLLASYMPSSIDCLESKDLVLKLADWLGLLESERLGRLLHGTDHRRWSTEEQLDIICWFG